ncbi:MAG: hypothetical protein CMN89_03095 [Sutterellaceae bacterium]|uniref:hypothetical protein n=1 Tax=Limnobacter sp. UBA7229 TaxID=1946762 RepID=UPI000C554A0C|nr:hypothetical protein [Limnobacter sp. UBA7229]MAG81305.1 hypothetical protein [Sutterellaceae bacterium]MAG81405.1 hypothetical protein [Sutterellaceae bacterium]MBT83454.1 hypothetical protein [Sutterellaceae bacterium]|tara:strand:- start:6786 stop:7913 length:1128 start_codon:yes stop_codon:yes gene_type:complete
MSKKALLVGGSGASGLHIARELEARGFDVTIFHTGQHELKEIQRYEHIHGDPHFKASIEEKLGQQQWDLTVLTYGRIRILAEHLRERTKQLIAVSGLPVVGDKIGIPLKESDPYQLLNLSPPGLQKLLPKIIETEQMILNDSASGYYTGSVVRYPYLYGPHSVAPLEWHVIKRIIDRRKFWPLSGSGLQIFGRCAAPNAAHLIGLMIDQPEKVGGKIYHAADEDQLTLREWIEHISSYFDYKFEFLDIPSQLIPLDSCALPMSGDSAWISAEDNKHSLIRHRVPVTTKAKIELGYQDVVEAKNWIHSTCEYLIENPPQIDGKHGRLGPRDFNYNEEDQLIKWWKALKATVPKFQTQAIRQHPYEHPKEISKQLRG